MPESISDYLLSQVPPVEMCASAMRLAHNALPQAIFNHSFRVFLFAKWLAEKESSEYAAGSESLALLFVACICHDIGASVTYSGGGHRFEIEGADAASNHLLSNGVSKVDAHRVWTAIALHTSPGIAERIDPFTRLVRLAVGMDLSAAKRQVFGAGTYCEEIERLLPRLDIERVLGDAVVKQAAKIPEKVDKLTWPDSEKHPAGSWPGILLRAHIENPGYEGVNPAF
jgi:hypothetical protein